MTRKTSVKTRPSWPKAIIFTCHAKTAAFRSFARCVAKAVDTPDLPALTGWEGPGGAQAMPSEAGAMITGLPDTAEAAGKDSVVLSFDTAGNMIGSVRFRPHAAEGPFCSVSLRWVCRATDRYEALAAFQSRCLSLCRDLVQEFVVHSAELLPEDAREICVPAVPLVSGISHIAVTNTAEVTDLYDDPNAFWSAGWEIADEAKGQRLLVRAMDVIGGPEYLERIIGHQWQMARAAKPGETRYETPDLVPEEAEIFNRGAARLQSVGYSESDQSLEYSCVLDRGEHIQGWEIYALRKIIGDGRSAEGWPIKAIRIVFLERSMALQEKRPLLDIGCSVWFYDDQGELQQAVE